MSPADIVFLVFIIGAAVFFGLYFLNRWASSKMSGHNEIIEKTRVSASIFVISKKRGKITEAHLPQAVMAQMPKYAKFMKMHLVQAKVGPQVATLICDKNVYEVLPVKKTVKVGLSGIYITDAPGSRDKKKNSGFLESLKNRAAPKKSAGSAGKKR
ncbi:MAG: hypothetical protein LBU36_07255 [Clostridiales bacterium]|jgi:hypothetical protein|nr:hypothetical protein [Clostridiales bacterium]